MRLAEIVTGRRGSAKGDRIESDVLGCNVLLLPITRCHHHHHHQHHQSILGNYVPNITQKHTLALPLAQLGPGHLKLRSTQHLDEQICIYAELCIECTSPVFVRVSDAPSHNPYGGLCCLDGGGCMTAEICRICVCDRARTESERRVHNAMASRLGCVSVLHIAHIHLRTCITTPTGQFLINFLTYCVRLFAIYRIYTINVCRGAVCVRVCISVLISAARECPAFGACGANIPSSI